MTQALGWFGIVRLGLVQTALGAIVVLMTSAINRVMVVELALPAVVPGALVALHYGVQVLRPRWGYGSDVGGRRTPWIVGGMAALAIGGVGAAFATALAANNPMLGVAVAVVAFTLVGLGVGAAGTSLLVLLATKVDPKRRAAAATVVWVMMIAGFAVTAPTAGHFLDPFTPMRLVEVTGVVAAIAFVVACLAVAGIEGPAVAPTASAAAAAPKPPFLVALKQVWAEPQARRFTIFVFVSMLAYSAQELILEPYAGIVFGMSVGTTTKLAGVQHGGVLAGMILVGVAGSGIGGRWLGSLRFWTVGGCLASAVALAAIAGGAWVGPDFPLRPAVFALGVANGAFAVAAIGSMMGLAGSGSGSREGTRMGLWGAAQALAFGLGGFSGTVAVDVARRIADTPADAYALVFLAEAALFAASAWMAMRIGTTTRDGAPARAVASRSPLGRPVAEASHG
ncbi:BCD family MFS transporter [uncultured Alsobacter sp.]|uniref:BCD family MFS transporter n=1 Tax=uncultured Alsobacter sp. TaxID=1748258 RepID=UPI0025DDBB09|nr:BCD family MFS transporter [uncultured Alsobacter sp.]